MDHRARATSARRRSRRPRRALRADGAPRLIAVDTNVLVYAHREEFDQHAAALDRLTELAEGDRAWGLPIFVVGEYLRVVTHPGYLDPPADPTLAMANVRALLDGPSCHLLLPGERFWALLQDAVEDSRATGNLVFDAQIVAVCLEHGADEVLTEDTDLRRFTSVRTRRIDQ